MPQHLIHGWFFFCRNVGLARMDLWIALVSERIVRGGQVRSKVTSKQTHPVLQALLTYVSNLLKK